QFSQLLDRSQKPWTKTTGCNPEALARSICCCSVSVRVGVMGSCALSFRDVSSECVRTMPGDIGIAPLLQRPYITRRSTLTCPYRNLPVQAPPTTSPAYPTHGRRRQDAPSVLGRIMASNQLATRSPFASSSAGSPSGSLRQTDPRTRQLHLQSV